MNKTEADTLTATVGENVPGAGREYEPVPQLLGLGFPSKSPPRLDHLFVMRRDDQSATATPIVASYANHLAILATGAFLGGVLLIGVLGLALYLRQRKRWRREAESAVVVQADLDCPKVISAHDQALLLANEEEETLSDNFKQLTGILETVEEQYGKADQQCHVTRPKESVTNTWQLHRSTSWSGDVTHTQTSSSKNTSFPHTGYVSTRDSSTGTSSGSSRPSWLAYRDSRSESWPGVTSSAIQFPDGQWPYLTPSLLMSQSVIPSSSDTSTRHDVSSVRTSSSTSDTHSCAASDGSTETTDISETSMICDLMDSIHSTSSNPFDFTNRHPDREAMELSEPSTNRTSSPMDYPLLLFGCNER